MSLTYNASGDSHLSLHAAHWQVKPSGGPGGLPFEFMLEEDGNEGTVAGGCGCCCCCGCGVGRYCFDVSDILGVLAKDKCEELEEKRRLWSEGEPGRRSRVSLGLFKVKQSADGVIVLRLGRWEMLVVGLQCMLQR